MGDLFLIDANKFVLIPKKIMGEKSAFVKHDLFSKEGELEGSFF
jgi:hypothetical protein